MQNKRQPISSVVCVEPCPSIAMTGPCEWWTSGQVRHKAESYEGAKSYLCMWPRVPSKCQGFCCGFQFLEQLGICSNVLGISKLTSLWPSYTWGFLYSFIIIIFCFYFIFYIFNCHLRVSFAARSPSLAAMWSPFPCLFLLCAETLLKRSKYFLKLMS